jgi:DNA-binding NarL/FixJ family response regulator
LERDPAIVHAAFAATARGYVLKSLADTDLLKTVETIVGGDLFIGRGRTRGDGDDPHHDAWCLDRGPVSERLEERRTYVW